MEVSIQQRLQDDLKDAMRSKQEVKSSMLRLLVAAVKNEIVNARIDGRNGVLSDGDVMVLIRREVKQHEESLLEAKNAGREDLVEEQNNELVILREYLPQQLSRAAIEDLVRQTIAEVGATTPKQQGQVMKALQPKVKDIADGKLVNEVVRELLK